MYRLAIACLAMSGCVGSMVRAPRPIPSDGVVDCTDSMDIPITAAAVGVVALAATLYLGTRDPQTVMDSGGVFWLPVLGGAGVTALFGAAEGASHARECRRAERRGAELAADIEHRQVVAREEANARYKRAAAAARVEDCAIVRALDTEVRQLDAEFHDVVFVRDVAIARCLAADEVVRAAVGTP